MLSWLLECGDILLYICAAVKTVSTPEQAVLLPVRMPFRVPGLLLLHAGFKLGSGSMLNGPSLASLTAGPAAPTVLRNLKSMGWSPSERVDLGHPG